ncbi:MAG: hypothetical protein Q9181_004193 [Wetmoreana brouardii]
MGIVGALVAQGLKKEGIPYTIFDAEPSAGSGRFREWTLAIHWSLPTLKGILPDNLSQRLTEAQCDPSHQDDHSVQIYNSSTNELLKEISSADMKRLSRRKLRSLCIEGLDVKWGKTLTNLSYGEDGKGVTAHFADGSSYEGDLVLGADGPRSTVRESLLGAEAAQSKPCGIVQNMTLVKYGDAEKALHVRSGGPLFYLGYNPSGIVNYISVQDIPSPDHPEDWSFIVGTSWLGERDPTMSNEARLADIRKAAETFAEPFRSASLWIQDGTPTFHDQVQYWPTMPFDNHGGRVTLAGDAAHPMPPHRGQGLNHAVCDCGNLLEAIRSIHSNVKDAKEAITAYDEELVKRGADEVNMSVKNALMVHQWDLVMQSPAMKEGIKKLN